MKGYETPLRYPGGKQKLAPFIREILLENGLSSGHYVEPYAGGAGVAVALLLDGTVSNIHLNDSNRGIYSFWYSLLHHTDEFCRRIISASLTVDEWRRQKEILKNPRQYRILDIGYAFFFLNRCNRSGIVNAGIIGGKEQKGQWKMDARFPRSELIRRIELIGACRKNISIKNMDAEQYITSHIAHLPQKTLIYCDPPYYNKADRLYENKYTHLDHDRVSKVIQRYKKHAWIVSYDNVAPINNFYSKRKRFAYKLQYNANTVYEGSEIFIFSDNLRIPSHSSIASIDRGLKEIS